MAVLFVIFAASSFLLLRQWQDNARGESTYADAMAVAMESKAETALPQPVEPEAAEKKPVWMPVPVEDDPVMEEMARINITALQEINADVLGWIRIPDTKIDYPLLQGEDNDFYLTHTWEKEPNSVGSIYLEHLCSPDLSDFNTIIYGHNMNNNSMFGDLENYSLPDFWKDHPYVYIASSEGVCRYEIFAFFRAGVESITYGLNFQQDEKKEDFLKNSRGLSWIETGIKAAITDRIITLSTCSGGDYSDRYVVQARLPMMETVQ